MSVVGTSRCDVPARVQRAEQMLEGVRTKVRIAPLNAARTAQRAVPTSRAPDTSHPILPVQRQCGHLQASEANPMLLDGSGRGVIR
jgi:hypothetical protein